MSEEWPNLTYPSGAPMPPYGAATPQEMITDALEWATAMLVARDEMNAAIHCGETRLSPVTVKIRTALGLWRTMLAEPPKQDGELAVGQKERGTFDSGGFFAALDAERLARRMNWKQVADESGVSASTLTRLAQGKRPDVDSLAALVDWSGLRVDDFVRRVHGDREATPLARTPQRPLRATGTERIRTELGRIVNERQDAPTDRPGG